MRFALVVPVLVTVLASVPGPAATAGPVLDCAQLVGDIAGAATQVTSAVEVWPIVGPPHCEVHGYVEPAVRFQLRLPMFTYTGRYLQYGCDGACGFISDTPFPDCHSGAEDFAVAATDDGHVGGGFDAQWAAGDQAARDDWFYRAPHVVSLAAKRIIARYYGAPPSRSYFSGCSTGGREGLLLAQRYPHDFDGIVAGAPVHYLGPLAMYQAWVARANTDAAGAPIITSAKLPVLHDAVLAACDGLDGLADGQLDDPRACRFDPARLRCAGIDGPDCLTEAQVAAAHKLYGGPTDAGGRRLYPGSQPFGSELGWTGWIVPLPEVGVPFAALMADGYLRYHGYPIGTPHSSLAALEFTVEEFDRLMVESVKGNAMSLDLTAFRAAGGRLIMWHGWADHAVPPGATVDYYQRLVQRDGLPETREWARLFMVPSLYHCRGGSRLTDFDPLGGLVGWVEQGRAPERIVATGRDGRTRPVFPYPLQAGYGGTGSIDDASNFVAVKPLLAQNDAVDWVGTGLHDIPGPVAVP